MSGARRLLWVVPEVEGGIRSYSNNLWPAVAQAAAASFEPLEPVIVPGTREGLATALAEVARLLPDVVHIQHEYGLFGSKFPLLYRFPSWLRDIRRIVPESTVVATAHTVLEPRYRYPLAGRGVQIPIRAFSNVFLRSRMRKAWGERTWGALDGVIVHSKTQIESVRLSGCPRVAEIPHFVPAGSGLPEAPKPGQGQVMIFGYISPEKGQDIAIEAFARSRAGGRLVIAGGVRRREEMGYMEHCRGLIRKLGLQERVEITGFVPSERLARAYAEADLVLAPFRETWGSGSLATAFAHGAPVLASDLALNRELAERVPGCLEFFKSGDPGDCAVAIDRLLASAEARKSLSKRAGEYRERYQPERIARLHLEFYG